MRWCETARGSVHPPRRQCGPRAWVLLALPFVFLLACRSPIGADRTGFQSNYRAQRASALDQNGLSTASLQLISFAGLQKVYKEDPDEALRQLQALVLVEKRRRPFASMAELYHLRGQRKRDRGAYLLSALYAYYYLFSEDLEPAPDPYDPLFRLACDLYNRGLALALIDDSGGLDLSDQVVETPIGPFELDERRPGFPWEREEFARFLPANAFQLRGLRDRVRRSGVGVPLIAVRSQESVESRKSSHVAPRLKLPATALMRPDGGLDALESGQLSGALEIYFPTDVEEVEFAGRRVPLEADFSAALAYSLEASPIWDFSLSGFFSGGDTVTANGVYLTQPYQPGKIPVLLLHGTASNPGQWAQLINGLQLDPALRSHYQLWVGLYHTGNPVLYSSWGIREALRQVVTDLDPEGTDEQLARMVVVGHSQGGLVARLLVSSSGDAFWGGVSSEPFEEYELSPEAREILGGSLFFEPLPFIASAVFISTPHRGSYLAGSWIGRFAQGFVDLPSNLSLSLRQLDSADRLPDELKDVVPTSVENMDPDSNFVRILQTLPFAPGVDLHSIVAVKSSGPVAEGNDGVVAYSSAHLDEAESELVVRHGHSCQNEPETVLELRRILLEHLGDQPSRAPEFEAELVAPLELQFESLSADPEDRP